MVCYILPLQAMPILDQLKIQDVVDLQYEAQPIIEQFPDDPVENYFDQPGSDGVHFIVLLSPKNSEFHAISFVPQLTLCRQAKSPKIMRKKLQKHF